MKNILVTGGAGYIGSHTVVELIDASYHPIVLDNFSNSDRSAFGGIRTLTAQDVTYYEGDYSDKVLLQDIIAKESIDSVIHFAAGKYVGESVADPLKYYQNNVAGFVSLLEIVAEQNIRSFIFSSSAAVYGNPPTDQVTEESPTHPESPYGWSKRMDEIILRDVCAATPSLTGIALRYFNVVGSHESAIIGESPRVFPQNLLPLIVMAVAGKIPELTVHGNDYPTPDGTCQRDYIHVVDLAKAHVAALGKSLSAKHGSYQTYNVSTGKPTSVLELITAFQKINGVKVPYHIGPRRPGDPVAYYATAEKAKEVLGWHATKTTDDAVRDAWHWHQTLSKS